MKALTYLAQIVGVLSAVVAWMVVVPILDLLQQDESEAAPILDLLKQNESEAEIVELFQQGEPEAA